AADACAGAGVSARLKWPNDLVFETGTGFSKLGGILAESRGGAVVVGIGLNVGWPAGDELPGATSLAALGAHVRPLDLLPALLAGLDEHAPDLALRYHARCATIGRMVRVTLPDGSVVEGLATTVLDDGRLLVVGDDGSERAFSVGNVV